MNEVWAAIQPYLPYIGVALPLVVVLVGLAVRGQLDDVARAAVGAAYRVAIKDAVDLQHEGIAWLTSPEGKDYRKQLAARAYDALPSTMYGVPVKLFVSRETFCALVEKAFAQIATLACEIQFPAE